MRCPNCTNVEMTKVMDEAIATWWKCPNCKNELVTPDTPERRNIHQRPDHLDGIHKDG